MKFSFKKLALALCTGAAILCAQKSDTVNFQQRYGANSYITNRTLYFDHELCKKTPKQTHRNKKMTAHSRRSKK